MAFPKCNCIHKNSDGTFPTGSGSIGNPYLHDKLSDECLIYADGRVVIPDEDGCIILPIFDEFNGFEDDTGKPLPRIQGCFLLPFGLDAEHWQSGSLASLVTKVEYEDESGNNGDSDYINNDILFDVGTLNQIPEVDNNLVELPQLNLIQEKLINHTNTSTTEEILPLSFSLNHLSGRTILAKVIIYFNSDNLVKVTPSLLFNNGEIPLSQTEQLNLGSIDVSGPTTYTFYKKLPFTNSNSTSTHKAELKLTYSNFLATSLEVKSATLSAILV